VTTERKTICLGMPSPTAKCHARGGAGALPLPRAARSYDVRVLSNNSSLLTANMNGLWAWALNVSREPSGAITSPCSTPTSSRRSGGSMP
jgi:hypothetical protein